MGRTACEGTACELKGILEIDTRKITPMVKWIIQNNLIKPAILQEFRNAFTELNIDFEEVKSIPFSPNLPSFEASETTIFYGSTSLIFNAYSQDKFKSGVFYSPDNFNVATYMKEWTDKMLNYDGIILKFSQFIKDEVDKKSEWFLRPNEDDKSFSGTVMTSTEIKDWYLRIKEIDNPVLNADTLIFASALKTITKEWRNFVVNGQVIDSSRYMLNGALNISREDCPNEMIEFVQKCTIEFSPHDIFVIDIAETLDGFKIIECNCFNGTGFYNHDIKKIVHSITNRMQEIHE